MKEQIQHTEGPWETHVGDDYIVVIKKGDTTDNPIVRVFGDDDTQAEANAAFIVDACNSHKELLQLVSYIAGELPEGEQNLPDLGTTIGLCKEFIAKYKATQEPTP